MIKAHHNAFLAWFYSLYFKVLEKIYFRKVSVFCMDVFPDDRSVLLLQNHFSLYDGYWSRCLSNQFFHRRFHAMMLEEQLKRRMFLTSAGVFSVRKNSRDLIQSLSYASELLQQPQNLVTVYPTGELVSLHQQNFSFQKGFERLINEKDNCSIALAVVLVDYFSKPRPEVRMYVQNYLGEKTAKAIEIAYLSFYQSCISKQTE